MLSTQLKTFFIYLGVALLALAAAALLAIPTLYYPLGLSGLCLGLAAIKLLHCLFTKWLKEMGPAAIALSCALLALALHFLLPEYHWTAESPEPVRLWPLWLAQLQGATAIYAIFAALDAKIDQLSAALALLLAVVTLFLMGYQGFEIMLDKTAGITVIGTIVILSGELLIKKMH